ncbi:uncharacterized protein LOC128333311 [Hemicordylus capensis]|uniref:uncharacterized protein LOC128333311 n=1 Tax=Hemicordylus capensis TaxID=884348 RepID=UPI0023045129|nr:uncharacterized protein LOC128333311 [Hemicordylus capensis]
MNSCCREEGGKQPLTSNGLPCSFQPLKASQSGQHGAEEKSVRLKRRRTRRERDCVKFGRNVTTDRVPDKRLSCKGLQKTLPPFWVSQLSSCATSTPIQAIKGSCMAKSVIITQNRLSHHLGMFNREVKSADIERLLSPRTEVREVTPLRTDSGAEMQLREETEPSKSSGAAQKSMPNEQLGSSVKDACGQNEDSVPTVFPAVPKQITEYHSGAIEHTADTRSQPSAGATAVDFGQQLEIQTSEMETFPSNASVVLNEKENAPPVTTTGTKLYREKSLRQLAQDLQKLLDLKAIFPGRNLISETRQAVIGMLLQQKKTLPDFSGLILLKKLAGGYNNDTTRADFKSAADRDQELQLQLQSSGGSRNSDQGVSLKKRREREPLFLTSPTPCPVHTSTRMAEERSAHREDFESFSEPEVCDQHSFYLAAVQPHPHLPSVSSQHVNSVAESSSASEGQSLQETFLRTAQHWEQGLRAALWESRSRPGKVEGANGQLPKKVSKRQCLPFGTQNSFGSVNLNVNDKGVGRFPLADSQQYSCVYEISPERWNFRETEPAAIHSLHPSQELCGPQPLDLGLRTTERAASESQTSFDVLKSIWSPKAAVKGAKLPESKALGFPRLAHQQPSSRELNLEQGQPKEFFQLYSIIPQQHCSLYRPNPQQEVCMPGIRPQPGNGWFTVLAKPRTHCQKVSLEQGRTSNSSWFGGLTEVPARMPGRRDTGCPRFENRACSLEERLLQIEEVQQLRVFQQLPMSYFPPSEALEHGHSPLPTLQGQLLGQSSPEPWAFPRMKLY